MFESGRVINNNLLNVIRISDDRNVPTVGTTRLESKFDFYAGKNTNRIIEV